MERRKAITTAAAASLTLLAGAAGIALNSRIVGASGDDKVGQLSPTGATGQPVVVSANDPASMIISAPQVEPTGSAPTATSSASGYADDDGQADHDDDEHEDGEYRDVDHEGDEYEGADDDD